ncbi:hypothetical protein [Spirosoma pollinicola]|uniref:Uncharacterized protein n=1 Tax=Spirosoma pollinicola TaxID=2057025 RepID=A0A2K8Z7P2_9BACT|nr:hypothetical protein [Spirosoma pollinicola]AUD05893.1 hypothetical protein CWM47_31050 [Spirosoma pollinicola]
METPATHWRLATGILSVLLLLLLIVGVYFWNTRNTPTPATSPLKGQVDSLVSVKRQLESNLNDVKSQLESATEENASLNSQIDNLDKLLSQTYDQLNMHYGDNIDHTFAMNGMNRTVARLNHLHDSVSSQLGPLQGNAARLSKSNDVLTDQNRKLQQSLNQRDTSLSAMVLRSALTSDAFRFDAIKPNGKQTAKAKKVNTLSVSFTVPDEKGLTGLQDVFLSLTDDHQQAMIPPVHTVSVKLAKGTKEVSVQAVQSVDFDQHPKRISFKLDPATAIKPGIYRASIYTQTAYLGLVEFRFRDSFWFF